ncbi:MAG: hypothetical protein J6U07_02905 [Fibrobacter sp.]|nr:hypothetical protein [Fibrobacter sp.]
METAKLVCDILMVVIAALAAWISIRTWRGNTKLEKYRMIRDYLRESREDKDVARFFYKIEYDERWYGPNFHGSELEPIVDKALTRYSYLIELLNDDVVDENGIKSAKYEISRILGNFDVQAYLFNLRNFTTGIKTFFPYADLVEYGKSKGILDDTFFNAELGVKKYGKTLNW